MKIEHITFITITFLAGSLFAIIGIFIDNMLYRAGISRKMKRPIIVGAYFIALIKVYAYTELSWFIATLVYILGAVFVVHRGDIWTTKDHGRWWWKSED